MSFPTISLAALDAHPVWIIDDRIPSIFENFSPPQQRNIVHQLEEFIEQVKGDGSMLHLLRLGVLTPENLHEMGFKKDHLLEKCYWQLAQLYRYSTPSRIAEAAPALRFVLDIFNKVKQDAAAKDVVPMLYLGVALTKAGGNDEEALNIFQEAFIEADKKLFAVAKSAIWARAHMSRLLRRMNRGTEAESQEKLIGEWVKRHPHALPPSELKKLVTDEADLGTNYILLNPDVEAVFKNLICEDPYTHAVIYAA